MQGWQGRLPILLSFSFAAVLLVLSAVKLRHWEGARLLWAAQIILLYLCWLFAESGVAIKEMARQETALDRGSCELYAAGRGATVVTALAMPTHWIAWGGLHYGGILLFVLGVGLRIFAIKALGERYSHRIRIRKDDAIVTRGPYRVVRHPAYVGMLLAHMGFVLFFFNWLSVVVLFGFFLPSVLKRIRIEEGALREIESYMEYSRTRKRLIPYLW